MHNTRGHLHLLAALWLVATAARPGTAAGAELTKETVDSARRAIGAAVLNANETRCLPAAWLCGLEGLDAAEPDGVRARLRQTAMRAQSPEFARLIFLQLATARLARVAPDAVLQAELAAEVAAVGPQLDALVRANPALAAALLGAALRASRQLGQPDSARSPLLKAGQPLLRPHRYPAQDVQAVMVLGLVEAAVASGDAAVQAAAETGYKELVRRFGAPDGSFCLSEAKPKAGDRGLSVLDGATVSGNAAAALAALGLAARLPGAHDQARRCLEATLPRARPTPEYAGLWLAAARCLERQGTTPVIGPVKLTPAPVPPAADPARGASASDAHVRLVAALDAPVTWGQTAALKVTLAIADGWHLYAHRPKSDDDVSATRLRFELPKGVEVTRLEYPPGEDAQVAGGPARVYTGTLTLNVTLKTPKRRPRGDLKLGVTARYQACNDELCAQPAKLSVELPLK